MALTGFAAGAPRAEPAGVAVCARGAALAFMALAARQGVALEVDGPSLLAERAALERLSRQGRISVGGGSRLLRAVDGWIALALPRPEDVSALPAWLEIERVDPDDPWEDVERVVPERKAAQLVARGRLLGMPVAEVAEPRVEPPPWVRVASCGAPLPTTPRRPPRVLDLSSLWAGPLCTRLLRQAGAEVLVVESPRRPDGARYGAARLFRALREGKDEIAIDPAGASGRAALERLLGAVDVVVESARPRALRQLGIVAEAWLRARPGLTWVSITGYGRREPGAGWVALGDDAAAAAGLAALAGSAAGGPLFCADAVADPLTGLHAAVAALAAHGAGGGVLLDLALRDVAAQAGRFAEIGARARVRTAGDGIEVEVDGVRAPVLAPRPPDAMW
jgi:hypothetical protein